MSTVLTDRWRRLRDVPYVPLADLPTPVQKLEALSVRTGSAIWVKRDDLTGERYGGNKVRKLEYLLGAALADKRDAIVTAGGAGSHHVLASALYGQDLGLEVHGVVFPQRWTRHVEDNLRADVSAGAILHPVRLAPAMAAGLTSVAMRLRLRRKKVMVIPPGGSVATGTLGYVEAGLEIARQIEGGVLPEPHAVFVPYGSGGTAAGLAVGLAAAGVMARVVAVRVVPRVIGTHRRLKNLVRETVALLRGYTDRFPLVQDVACSNLVIDHDEYGEGYGARTSAGRNAMRLARSEEGIELDATYSAKCLASLLRHAKGKERGNRLLYVHTLNSRSLEPLVAATPRLPPRLERLLTR